MMSLSVKTAMAWLTYIVIWALQATSFAIPKQTYHSAKPSKSFLHSDKIVTRKATTTTTSLLMVGQKYLPCIKIEELPQPGSATSRIVEGVAICIVVDEKGSIFALADKCPPAGKRLSLGTIGDDGTIQDPSLGTKFSLRTGNVVGAWCPDGMGRLIGPVFTPAGVETFPIRQKGRSLVVQIKARSEDGDDTSDGSTVSPRSFESTH